MTKFTQVYYNHTLIICPRFWHFFHGLLTFFGGVQSIDLPEKYDTPRLKAVRYPLTLTAFYNTYSI